MKRFWIGGVVVIAAVVVAGLCVHGGFGGGGEHATSSDPWDQTPSGARPDPDAPPSLLGRKKFVDNLCPVVLKPFFFEVKKDGRTAHILGTRHLSFGLDKFPQVVRDDFDAASLAVFEIPPGTNEPKPTFPDEPLRQEVGEEDWGRLRALTSPATAKRLEHKSAIVAAVVLLTLYEDPSALLDKQLEARAEDRKIPTTGFETHDFQLGLLGDLFSAKVVKALVHLSYAQLKKSARKGIVDYCLGTERDLDASAVDDMDPEVLAAAGLDHFDGAAFNEKLIYSRNRAWIPQIGKLLAQDRVFIAVGAAHLQGPKGVIELLKHDGYEITRITH